MIVIIYTTLKTNIISNLEDFLKICSCLLGYDIFWYLFCSDVLSYIIII